MLILRRSNCIVTASGIVTLCKRPYSALYGRLVIETSLYYDAGSEKHHTRKSTDYVRKGDFVSYRFLLQVWSFHITVYKIKVED
jgi:hypothetical protein